MLAWRLTITVVNTGDIWTAIRREKTFTTAARHGACWDLMVRQSALLLVSHVVRTGDIALMNWIGLCSDASVVTAGHFKQDKLCVNCFRRCYGVQLCYNPLTHLCRVSNLNLLRLLVCLQCSVGQLCSTGEWFSRLSDPKELVALPLNSRKCLPAWATSESSRKPDLSLSLTHTHTHTHTVRGVLTNLSVNEKARFS